MMTKSVSSDVLRQLRNDIPIEQLIANVLYIPHKHTEGYFRFLCPMCYEFNTAIKKETNLARCFRCRRNFNPIDMVMTYSGSDFLETVRFLIPVLKRFNRVK
jgi:DNA primase